MFLLPNTYKVTALFFIIWQLQPPARLVMSCPLLLQILSLFVLWIGAVMSVNAVVVEMFLTETHR
jgi:predicted tellurium resistance membrane protein TerC